MRNTLFLALNDLRLLMRDRASVFWIIVFPVIYGIFFGLMIGGGEPRAGALHIALIDEDQSDGSRAFVAELASSEAVRLDFTTIDQARDAVRRGRRTALVHLKPGFGETFGLFGSEEERALEVGIDPARRIEAGYLQGVIMQAAFGAVQRRILDPGEARRWLDDGRAELLAASDVTPSQRQAFLRLMDAVDTVLDEVSGETVTTEDLFRPSLATTEITREESGPRSSFEITFPSAMLWAIIGCVTGFAVGLVQERTRGTLLRLHVSPLTRSQILAGKGLACAITCLLVLTAQAAFGHWGFGVRISSVGLLAMAIVCITIGFTGMMMLLSVLGRTEQAVGGLSMAFLLVMAMLGGGMVPLLVMPQWMQTGSNISPIKWGIISLEGAIWREFTLTDMLLPCGILVAIGVIAFAMGVRRLPKAEA